MEKLITADEAQKILEEFDQMVESFIESKNLGAHFAIASVKVIKVTPVKEEGELEENDYGIKGGSSFAFQGEELSNAVGEHIGRNLHEMSIKVLKPTLIEVIKKLAESLSSNEQEEGEKK